MGNPLQWHANFSLMPDRAQISMYLINFVLFLILRYQRCWGLLSQSVDISPCLRPLFVQLHVMESFLRSKRKQKPNLSFRVVSCGTVWYHVASCGIGGTVWYCVVSCDIVWYCVFTVWYCVIPCDIVWYRVASSGIVW